MDSLFDTLWTLFILFLLISGVVRRAGSGRGPTRRSGRRPSRPPAPRSDFPDLDLPPWLGGDDSEVDEPDRRREAPVAQTPPAERSDHYPGRGAQPVPAATPAPSGLSTPVLTGEGAGIVHDWGFDEHREAKRQDLGAGEAASAARRLERRLSAYGPVARGVAWQVILGPSRAGRPWRPLDWRHG